MPEDTYERLSRYLTEQGLRSTRQRDSIVRMFTEAGRHVSTEELYLLVKKKDKRIGYATVARTLKLLANAGLAHERRFDDGVNRFEYDATNSHHDHLICTRCNKIIEFENEQIEHLQKLVARKKKFRVTSHKLELYGLCADCQSL